MRFYVYELVRKSDSKVLYVGKGSGRRMDLHHLFASRWKTGRQSKLYSELSAIIQDGDDFFAHKVFESDDEGEVLQKELDTINKYGLDTLLNGVSAHVFGAINSLRARQVRLAISKARTGMRFSDEHRRSIGLAQVGRKLSPATRLKISQVQTGKKRGHYKSKLSLEEKRERYLEKFRRYYRRKKFAEKGERVPAAVVMA